MEEKLVIPNTRLLSLDAFRGLTVAAMILVNNPGDWGNIYAPLKHAEWHGCTPTDLIFPFFLFIVGVSIVFSLGNRKANGTESTKIIVAIIKRASILFALGIILALFPDVFVAPLEAIATVRIPGVLQRIGIVFLITGILFYKTGQKTQILIWILILLVYWILLTFVPVPGGIAANLGKDTGLGAWLDRTVLTESHLWKLSRTWDPEGILSTLPAIATGISGSFAGVLLHHKNQSANKKALWLTIAGCIAVVLGLIWNFSFPLNKALWTSSYVLFTSGLAAIFLASLYWLIDVKRYQTFSTPFVVYGVNAITVYFLSTVMAKLFNFIKVRDVSDAEVSLKTWIFQNYLAPNFSPLNASLAWAILFLSFWFLILWWMYQRKLIIKV